MLLSSLDIDGMLTCYVPKLIKDLFFLHLTISVILLLVLILRKYEFMWVFLSSISQLIFRFLIRNCLCAFLTFFSREACLRFLT